jgi:hypothetical protein
MNHAEIKRRLLIYQTEQEMMKYSVTDCLAIEEHVIRDIKAGRKIGDHSYECKVCNAIDTCIWHPDFYDVTKG